MRRRLLLLAACGLGIAFGACSGDTTNPNDDASTDVTSPTDSPQSSDVVTTKDGAPTDAGVDAPAKPPCTAQKDQTGFTNRTAQGNPYVAYVPASYNPSTPWPLVVALHGAGDTAQNYLNVIWKGNADADGFIVIAPEGTYPVGQGFSWNGSDETLILAAAQDVYACYAIDPKKEIMHGFSAGGIMAYMIGLDHAQLFSGISISSADLGSAEAIYGGNLLPSAWKIPVSHFHGTQDQNFPISYAIAGMNVLTDAGHTFYWHPFDGGHTTTPQFANTMYNDLKSSTAP